MYQIERLISNIRNPAYYLWKINNFERTSISLYWVILIVVFNCLNHYWREKIDLIVPAVQVLFILSEQLILNIIKETWIAIATIKQIHMIAQSVLLGLQVFSLCHISQDIFVFGIYSLFQQEIAQRIPTIRVKLFSFITQIILWFIFGYRFDLFGPTFLILQLVLVSLQEVDQWNKYEYLRSLYSVINSIPNAVCIVNQDKQLVFSNDNFQRLALNLNNKLKGQVPILKEELVRAQLTFIGNLKLDEFTVPTIQSLTTFQGKNIEDNYIIKNINFRNKKPLKIINEENIDGSTNNYSSPLNSDESELFQEQLFGSTKLIRKQFTSEVLLQVEMDHQLEPSYYLQNAIQRRQKAVNIPEADNLNIASSQISNIYSGSPVESEVNSAVQSRKNRQRFYSQMSPLRKKLFSCNQEIQQFHQEQDYKKQFQQLDDSIRKEQQFIINQRIKFLVQLLQSQDTVSDPKNTNNEYSPKDTVYFIQDLTPMLAKEMQEKVDRNLFRSISHDLVTHLNGAHGYVEELLQNIIKFKKDKIEFSRKQTHYFAECEFYATQALNCIKLQIYKTRDIIDFRDIIRETFKINKSQFFHLDGVIRECVSMVEGQVKAKNLYLTIDFQAIDILIQGDKERLTQVILNLLSNSIKFTEQGGLTICVKPIQEEPNSSFQFSLTNVLEINVRDTGIGLDEENLGILAKKIQLIDEFEKVSKDSVGVGIGLSVCKHIIQQMSPKDLNQLCVHSEKNCFTEFAFYLASESYQKNQINLSNEFQKLDETERNFTLDSANVVRVNNYNRSTKSSKIINTYCICNDLLIVDDEQFNLDILSIMTKGMGFEITVAYNGKEALAKLQDKIINKCSNQCHFFKGILMDINMPIMDGWDAVQRMREMQGQQQFKIIAVTGYCNYEDQKKCIEHGFDQVICKPATRKKIIDVLNSFSISPKKVRSNT